MCQSMIDIQSPTAEIRRVLWHCWLGPDMTYNVFSGTLNPTQSINQSINQLGLSFCADATMLAINSHQWAASSSAARLRLMLSRAVAWTVAWTTHNQRSCEQRSCSSVQRLSEMGDVQNGHKPKRPKIRPKRPQCHRESKKRVPPCQWL